MGSDQKLLLTVPECADRLGLGRSFMYELVQKGEIASLKLGRARRALACTPLVGLSLPTSDALGRLAAGWFAAAQAAATSREAWTSWWCARDIPHQRGW